MTGSADQQKAAAAAAEAARGGAAPPAPAASRQTACPPHVLEAIYGKVPNKKEALEHSLQRWWTEYADRKNDEEDEHVADSLLYDRNHLPRTAPAPECVQRALQQQRQEGQQQGRPVPAQVP